MASKGVAWRSAGLGGGNQHGKRPGNSSGADSARGLWVDLRQTAGITLADKRDSSLELRTLHDPGHLPKAVRTHYPRFICFDFDLPDAPGLMALARTRRDRPGVSVLMLTGFHLEAVALWALRLPVWDVLVKPVAGAQLVRHLLRSLTRRAKRCFCLPFGLGLVVPPLPPLPLLPLLPLQPFPPLPDAEAGTRREGNRVGTQAAIDGVAAQFSGRIALEHAAALCRFSTSRFCRVFRQEHGVSFGKYLLHYRIERACERLAVQGAMAKQVAYTVGFNDLSYFTWASNARPVSARASTRRSKIVLTLSRIVLTLSRMVLTPLFWQG